MSFANLPPLKALRYFEAAARNKSFTLAADELHITQSAVSQQIRNLESFMGAALFKRGTSTVVLTDLGREYFLTVSKALERIETATAKAKRASPQAKRIEKICLSVSPSFSHLWLIKKLSRFNHEIKEIQLALNVSRHYVDFEVENVDMAIRHGVGVWPGLHADLLMKDRMVAVCSPGLLQNRNMPKNLEDVGNFPILEDPVYRYWTQYARGIGQQLDLTEAIHYDDSGVIVEAAINGQGIAMARESLAAASLSDGKLIKLFDANFSENLGYYIVFPLGYKVRRDVVRVSKWLRLEASRSRTC